MKLIQVLSAVAVSLLLTGCLTNTTINKSVDAPVPIEGLNVLYVNAPLTVSGDGAGYSPASVTVDVNQLAGAVTRELPKKFEGKAIPASVVVTEVRKGSPSIKVNEQFPLTAKTHHLLVITPVGARETCRVQPGGYKSDCATRLTVSTRLLAPGNLTSLWESRVQEMQMRLFNCTNCAARFDSLANDIADAVDKVVVKRPVELSQGLAGQLKPDNRPLLDLRQQPDGVTQIIGAPPKK